MCYLISYLALCLQPTGKVFHLCDKTSALLATQVDKKKEAHMLNPNTRHLHRKQAGGSLQFPVLSPSQKQWDCDYKVERKHVLLVALVTSQRACFQKCMLWRRLSEKWSQQKHRQRDFSHSLTTQ